MTAAPGPAPGPVEPAASAAPAAPTTLLGVKPPEATPAPESVQATAAPVEAAPDASQAPEGQSVDPAPPPAYEPFTLPEGMTHDGERLAKFTGLLSNLESTAGVDHATVQQFGQELMDFHIAEVQRAASVFNRKLEEVVLEKRAQWRKDFESDPEIGGNRKDTTINAALEFIRTHAGTPEQQQEFADLMNQTGLGDHPVVIRTFAHGAMTMREPGPLAATRPAAVPKSKVQAMYGGRTN